MQDTIPIIRDVAPLESKSPPKTTTTSKSPVPIITEVPKPVETESQPSINEQTESIIENAPTSVEPTKSEIKQSHSAPTEEYVPIVEEKSDVSSTKSAAHDPSDMLSGIFALVLVILMIWIPIKIHQSARPGTRPQLWIMILLFFLFPPAWLIILIFTKR